MEEHNAEQLYQVIGRLFVNLQDIQNVVKQFQTVLQDKDNLLTQQQIEINEWKMKYQLQTQRLENALQGNINKDTDVDIGQENECQDKFDGCDSDTESST